VVEVNGLIANLLTLSRHSLPEAIRIAKETAPSDLHTFVDPQQLEHALLNLVLNAGDAMRRGGGSLTVRSASRRIDGSEAAERQVAPGRYVEIRIEDTGVGMDQATLSRAVEPFFTTKEFGSGSGLGLSIVYGFARQSGGALDIASTPGIGTAVALLLPASAAPPKADSARAPTAAPRTASRLVLLVEDDADVRTVIRRQLTEIGHMVIEAPAGDEALAIVGSAPELSVLVTDIVMPGAMDGRRLAELARQRRPELRVVLVTGYAEGLEGERDRLRPFTVVRKPCTKEELAAAIEGAPR
jgi:CheY-like chemotaxis protein